MPPRINLFTARKAVPVLRSSSTPSARPSILDLQHRSSNATYVGLQKRWNSSSGSDGSAGDNNENPDRLKGPTEDALPHVSEEAAAMDDIMSKEKRCDGIPSTPELEQGTPISEILQRDKEAQKHAPKVMQDMMKKQSGGTRSFSTSARRLQEDVQASKDSGIGGLPNNEASAALVANMISQVDHSAAELHTGLKFSAPEPLPKTENFRTRYEPLLDQFTKLLMHDGKLALAQKNMSHILDILRTTAPPQPSSRRPLLPGPPAPQLPLNPVLYLNLIVDSVAPLLKIRNQKGIAGGGAAVQIPVALMQRQRWRTAIRWIIDASDKRRDSKFANRVAQELIAVAEGRSGVWDRREQVHKLAVSGRANLGRRMRFRVGLSNNASVHLPLVIWDLTELVGASVAMPAPFQLQGLDRHRYDVNDNDDSDNGPAATVTPPSSSGQGIELVELQPPSTATANSTYPTRRGARDQLETKSSRAPIGRWSIDRRLQGSWEKGEQQDEDRFFRLPHIAPQRVESWAEALRQRQRPGDKAGAKLKMKFSHSLQFNAVPDWSAYYIAYSNLKKLIYSLEQEARRANGQPYTDTESAPLLNDSNSSNSDVVFRRALDAELDKICCFFQYKESDIFGEVDEITKDAADYAAQADGVNVDPMSEAMIKSRQRPESTLRNRSIDLGRNRRMSEVSEPTGDEGEDEVDSEDDRPVSEYRGRQRSHYAESTNPGDTQTSEFGDSTYFGDSRIIGYAGQSSSRLIDPNDDQAWGDPKVKELHNAAVALKNRVVDVYVTLCGLKSYSLLNKTGFSKALKKYDKILDRNLRRDYMNTTVSPAYPFTGPVLSTLKEQIEHIEHIYADLVTTGNLELARRELRLHLREHVIWERNTVWREMIGIERKAQAANVGIRRTLLGDDDDPATAQRQGDEQEIKTKEFSTPLGRYSVPQWLCSLGFGALILILVIFAILLTVPILKKPEQQNCLAMLVFVSLLWATEVIPLFVTSLLIPFLVVILRIMTSEETHQRLGPKEATNAAFAAMWTPVIMLLLGGFTIAAALSKYDIARRMAMFVLSKAGTKPHVVLLTNMFVSMFLSMWISNVASPVLCYSIIQPLLRNLSPDSSFAKAVVLGIALAANIGGVASPIASPQNIIALQNMHPSISWGTWFFIAIPVSILSIVLVWVLLLVTFHPGRDTTIVPIKPVKDKFSGVQYFITIVTLSTIALWCASHQLEHVFGDMGVIAIIPIVLFFGTGILTKEDFNNFLWTIIILAAGGLCLGKAVTSSGLLHTLAQGITSKVEDFSLYGVLIVFSGLILVIATFISHTVAALIMLPLVRQVGVGMDEPHPNLLVMASAMMCSVAMALPTSGFPNMTAIMTEVPQTGHRYLKVRHFFTRGIPSSIMCFVVIITIGYGLMYVAGL